MATKTKRPSKKKLASTTDADGPYLLKLVLYTVIGTQWLWFETPSGSIPVPIGLLIGLVFAMHEHFQVDRKIEYAVLLAAMLAGFIAKVGIFIAI
jgi:hypothetical protein